MKAYFFFSVHEQIFDGVCRRLRQQGSLDSVGGFVWGEDQRRFLADSDVAYEPIDVFTRDILPDTAIGTPDLEYLESCEQSCGVSVHRVIAAERHLLAGRSYDDVLCLTEMLFRFVERRYREYRPDVVISEDVSCLASYIHWLIAQREGIPFWALANTRLRDRVIAYKNGLQRWSATEARFAELRASGLDEAQRAAARRFVEEFRERPQKPPVMKVRERFRAVGSGDFGKLRTVGARYFTDPQSPVLTHPVRAIGFRLRRVALSRAARFANVYETPPPGERYVLFPLHFQPEATTLVQAPLYLDQPNLIQDIARSLPVGYRLYVKDHASARGRWSLDFYRKIKNVVGVRLIGPDDDSWSLLRGAAAIAVITGTMGWEGLLFGKPVITFGSVFYNDFPLTLEAANVPKDRWYELFREALFEHEHDEELLLRFVSSLLETTYPGFMRNSVLFPWVLEPENLDNLAAALTQAMDLPTAYSSEKTRGQSL